MGASYRIAYIGNFEPEHSTENHVREALTRLGHTVEPMQENVADTWTCWSDATTRGDLPDLVLWTRTGWDWPHHCGWTWAEAVDHQLDALAQLALAGLPVVGFHLDRWWGLNREGQVYDEPFFRCDLVATADGGHDHDWELAGVRHLWLAPAVLEAECLREPRYRREYQHDVTFVGSWRIGRDNQGGWVGYHEEWAPHRKAMLDAVARRYRRRFVPYPRRRGLRGADLTDLYHNARVVVGDSCLAPVDAPPARYWSDRVPETVGRGGLLVHPHVDGIEDHYEPGEHLATYPLGDYEALVDQVERYLAEPSERNRVRKAGQAHVLAHHTYERRMDQLLAACAELGLL